MKQIEVKGTDGNNYYANEGDKTITINGVEYPIEFKAVNIPVKKEQTTKVNIRLSDLARLDDVRTLIHNERKAIKSKVETLTILIDEFLNSRKIIGKDEI